MYEMMDLQALRLRREEMLRGAGSGGGCSTGRLQATPYSDAGMGAGEGRRPAPEGPERP